MTTPGTRAPAAAAADDGCAPVPVRPGPPAAGTRAVVVPVVLALALLGAAAAVGALLTRSGSHLYVDAPPLIARWMPHVGPGTPAAILVAVIGSAVAGRRAIRLRWSWLLALGYLGSLAWTVSLSWVDVGLRGWAAPLGERDEYLHDLPRIVDVRSFLATFSDHILDFRPGSWTTHVSSHPPLATLFFRTLDRLGLGGQTWAGIAVVVVGCSTAVTVPVALRALGAAGAARAVVPYLVFFPGAVWVATSADGMFAGVMAAGLAACAWGSTRRSMPAAVVGAAVGGLLLAATLYLSYGLAVAVVVVAAVAWCSLRLVRRRRGSVRPWVLAWVTVVAAVAAVAILFSAAGFHWFSALGLLRTRYYQGIASERPYGYFVWANLAALAVSAGPVVAPAAAAATRSGWSALRGAVGAGRRRANGRSGNSVPVPALLTLATLVAVLLADLSGLSKAETERIWLPFGVWLLCGAASLPPVWRRRLLQLQIVTALLVNHLLLTHW